LVSALSEIQRLFKKSKSGMLDHEYISPRVMIAPQEAFYSEKQSVELDASVGKICTEFVMCYPPGIPILAPGEEITSDVINYIKYAKEKGCSLTGTEDMNTEYLNILKGGN